MMPFPYQRPGRLPLATGLLLLVLVLSAASSSFGQNRRPWRTSKADLSARASNQLAAASRPVVIRTAHTHGNMRLTIANNGTFGAFGQSVFDPFSGEMLPSCEYPRGSDIVFLWVAAVWVGAIVDNDTLVSCGSEDNYITDEFWPDPPELGGEFKYGSIDINSKYYSPGVEAYSEEDIIATYYDTITDPSLVSPDPFDNRGHIPLGIQIDQRTMAWSYEYADDFILFDYNIKNVSSARLRRVYLAIWVDGDVWHTSRNGPEGWDDDIAGFYRYHPALEGCGFIDTVNIAWHADNDGDPVPADNPANWDFRSAKGVVGTKVVRTPSDSLQYAYNWWIWNPNDPALDFGPRMAGSNERPFRQIGAGLGTPEGDASKYHVMSSNEFDYDLMETGLNHTTEGFLPRPAMADIYAKGFDCRYLLSFGPFDMEPGQSLPITFAWVGGEDFHQEPSDFARLFDPSDPSAYYGHLNFDNMALNARWASWVYDNPGIDTDSDGYRGKFRLCQEGDSTDTDTLWYEGDGIPDFRGAGPPPAPALTVIPTVGKLTIRWNGYYSENARDIFTNRIDFEGYRVYAGLDERSSSYALLASFDRHNYSRLTWLETAGRGKWVRDDVPYSLVGLRSMYGDSLFDPLDHPRNNPVLHDGVLAFFEKQDFNHFDLTDPKGIHKVWPKAPYPGTDSSLWQESDLVPYRDVPLPRFFEYEFVYENLLPTIEYYVAVTAFDYGSPSSGLLSLESKPENNTVAELPQIPADTVEAKRLDVIVYPNPYRIDAGYARDGFENRLGNRPVEYSRLINFTNLPKVCRIYIYSLDGDLIRQFEHNYPAGGPGSMHATWDMITRNSQSVVSGLYYWVVESDQRTQVGRFAIIR